MGLGLLANTLRVDECVRAISMMLLRETQCDGPDNAILIVPHLATHGFTDSETYAVGKRIHIEYDGAGPGPQHSTVFMGFFNNSPVRFE